MSRLEGRLRFETERQRFGGSGNVNRSADGHSNAALAAQLLRQHAVFFVATDRLEENAGWPRSRYQSRFRVLKPPRPPSAGRPPPPARPPEKPALWGRASFTVKGRPSRVWPDKSRMARSRSSPSASSTNPNPL